MTSDSASRVTRSSRSLQRALLLFVACLVLAGVLGAQEPVPPGTTGEPAPQQADADRPQQAEDSQAEPAPPDAAPDERPRTVGSTPDRFEPTEKVRADFDVSFPVDI
ncbi:MAG TPA: hypothetical protein VLM41_03780 [Steroidobacteraceae bacterium]|nr:hypothetical protein [Steroidobacteraceae bacterium]